jgi:hypothetical protein
VFGREKDSCIHPDSLFTSSRLLVALPAQTELFVGFVSSSSHRTVILAWLLHFVHGQLTHCSPYVVSQPILSNNSLSALRRISRTSMTDCMITRLAFTAGRTYSLRDMIPICMAFQSSDTRDVIVNSNPMVYMLGTSPKLLHPRSLCVSKVGATSGNVFLSITNNRSYSLQV